MGFHTRGILLVCCLQQRKINAFQRKLHILIESNDDGRVPYGNRKSQPTKVWSINTKYHVVLTNNTFIKHCYTSFNPKSFRGKKLSDLHEMYF